MFMRFREWARPLAVDRTARTLILIALVANLLSWLTVVARLAPSIVGRRIIALHYSIYLGVDAVGPAWQALALPAIGTLIIVMNAALARLAYVRQSRSAALVLLGLTALIESLALVASVYLVLINLRV